MTKFTIESTTDDTAVLILALAYVALAIHNQTSDDPVDLTEMNKYVTNWKNGSAPVVNQYDLSPKLFNSVMAAAASEDEGFEDLATSFRNSIKENFKRMLLDYKNVDHNQKSTLSAILSYFNSGSESAFKVLVSRAGSLGSPSLRRAYAKVTISPKDDGQDKPAAAPAAGVGDQKVLLAKLKAIMHKVPNTSHEQFLTPNELKTLGDTNPKLKEEYGAVYSRLRILFMSALKSIVISGNATYMPIPKVLEKMKTMGLTFSLFAQNSNHPGLFVDDKGNFGVTPQGNALKTSIVQPTLILDINPKFDFNNPSAANNPYVYLSRQSDSTNAPGKRTKNYSSSTSSNNAQSRQVKIKDLHTHLKDYINKWRMDLDKPTMNGILATVAEAAYLTAARMQAAGGESKGEATFGVLSWRVEHIVHIDPKKSTIEFKYRAKSGKTQHIKLNAATIEQKNKAALTQMIRNMSVLMKGKKPTDKIFTFNKQPLTLHHYKEYLKHHVGYEGGPHKFRHVRGTELFEQLISKPPFAKGKKPTTKEVTDFFKETATKVGAILGHKNSADEDTATTAIRYYINAEPMAEYFESQGVRPPKVVEERIKKLGINDDEGHENDDHQPAESPKAASEPTDKKANAKERQAPAATKPGPVSKSTPAPVAPKQPTVKTADLKPNTPSWHIMNLVEKLGSDPKYSDNDDLRDDVDNLADWLPASKNAEVVKQGQALQKQLKNMLAAIPASKPAPVAAKPNAPDPVPAKPSATTIVNMRGGKKGAAAPAKVINSIDDMDIDQLKAEMSRIGKIMLKSSPADQKKLRMRSGAIRQRIDELAAKKRRPSAIPIQPMQSGVPKAPPPIKHTKAAPVVKVKPPESKKISVVEPAAAAAAGGKSEVSIDDLIAQMTKLHKKLAKTVDKTEKRAITKQIVDLSNQIAAMDTEDPEVDPDQEYDATGEDADTTAEEPEAGDEEPEEPDDTDEVEDEPDDEPPPPDLVTKPRRKSAFG